MWIKFFDLLLASAMSGITAQVDDLIEETRMLELDDAQVQWRLRKFTQICEREIESGIPSVRKRRMLLERLEIIKCLYDHSPVAHPSRVGGSGEQSQGQRIKRLQNIVRRRRMALEMIERVDTGVANRIIAGLEYEYAVSGNGGPVFGKREDVEVRFELSSHHWYFFYFNLFLLCFLIGTFLLVFK